MEIQIHKLKYKYRTSLITLKYKQKWKNKSAESDEGSTASHGNIGHDTYTN